MYGGPWTTRTTIHTPEEREVAAAFHLPATSLSFFEEPAAEYAGFVLIEKSFTKITIKKTTQPSRRRQQQDHHHARTQHQRTSKATTIERHLAHHEEQTR
jgi:hypothetical protein